MLGKLFNLTVKAKLIAIFVIGFLIAISVVVAVRVTQIQAQTDRLLTERLQNNANMTFGIFEIVQTYTLWLLDFAANYAQYGLTYNIDTEKSLFYLFNSVNYSENGINAYENILVFDGGFNITSAANPEGDTVNLGLFYGTHGEVLNEPWVSPAFVNPESGRLQMLFSRPVTVNGQIIGFVAVISNTEMLKFVLRDFIQVYDSFVNVADSYGTIFFSNRALYIGRHIDELGVYEAFGEIPMNTLFEHNSALSGIDKIAYITTDPELNWTIISFFDADAVESTALLIFVSLVPTLTGILIIVVFAMYIIHRSLSPLQDLAISAKSVAKGDFSVKFRNDMNDEIGQVSDSFLEILRALVILGNNFKNAEKAIARGDMEYSLSDSRLGGVFDDMLDSTNNIVTHIQQSMYAVVEQHETMVEQHETILASINYSRKIQKNLLPTHHTMATTFCDYSVIWSPRDIVGGDIYWLKTFDEGAILCVCDCTGHGIPGALLTMLVISALESAVRSYNYKDTAEIVWRLEKRFTEIFSINEDERSLKGTDIRDGCDLAVLFIANNGNVTFSSGHINIFVCDGNKVIRHKGQRINIGEGKISRKEDILVVNIPPNPNNKFYIASDGLFEQPGGENAFPYGYAEFMEIILENHAEKQAVVSDKISRAFEEYRRGEPRVDDVTLVTFKSGAKGVS